VTDDLTDDKRASSSISHQWRLRYYRPAAVGFTGVSLIILGLVALTASPFLLIAQQMNGNTSFIPDMDPKIAGAAQAGIAAFFCLFGFFILRGKNWARWGYLLFGAGLCGLAGWEFQSPWVALGVVIYLGFGLTLFGSKANEFFRLLKED
jgi:hypothetical protein